ncbi:MAG: protein kinase [Polyangiaceae bacterium]
MAAKPLVADRFELLEVIGQGAMGRVYRAIDRQTGSTVALKLLHAHMMLREQIQRFEREAEVLAKLSHPAIAAYVAHGETLVTRSLPPGPPGAPPREDLVEKQRYLAMQWLDGESLQKRLEKSENSSLTVPEALLLGKRLATALAAAHAIGVVHRDLKPSNIILEAGDLGRASLVDFGIARLRSAAELTSTGMMLGTPGYMSPEQARGSGDVDARADVYALGCVLFRCLAGRLPFTADDPLGLLLKVVLEEPPRLDELRAELPEPIVDLVARLLQKSPADRPADGHAVLLELEAIAPPVESEPGPVSRMGGAALTGNERRILCLVLAKPGPARTTLPSAGFDHDAVARRAERELELLREAAKHHGASLEVVADGSILLLFHEGEATDQAARAASAALAVHMLMPDAFIAVAAGRAILAGALPVGEVIDRAVSLLGQEEGVVIDPAIHALLDARFERRAVADDVASPHVLLREVAHVEIQGRTLLGRATPLVGREGELAQLESVFTQCATEPCAQAMIVTAPAGLGKSRLRRELANRLATHAEGVTVLGARGDELTRGSPFGLVAQLIKAAAGVQPQDPPPLITRRIEARLHDLGDRDRAAIVQTASFLTEMLGAQLPGDEVSRTVLEARASPLLMGDQMRRAFEHWLRAETSQRTTVLLLDDLQWGDLPSVDVLDAALRNFADVALLVVAFARPEVHELFPKLWAERGLTEVRLRPLSRKACEKLVRAVLQEDATPELLTMLTERSEGNAFFLEELLRAIVERGKDTLPESVLAMVQTRLSALSAEVRRVLRAASVFGTTFTAAGVRALLGGSKASTDASLDPRPLRERLDDHLKKLLASELIEHRPATPLAAEAYAFRHTLVREAAYMMLTDADRQLGHKLAAKLLEETGSTDPIALAEHHVRAGAPERATACYLRAASAAFEGNDVASARSHIERGLATSPAGELRGKLLLLRAEIELESARPVEAIAPAADAQECLAPGSAAWCDSARILASAYGRTGHHTQLVAVLRTLEATLQRVEPEARSAFAQAFAELARQLLYAGRRDAAAIAFARLDAFAPEGLSLRVRAWLHWVRSVDHLLRGDLSKQLEEAEAAVKHFDEAGDIRNASMARSTVAAACIELGAVSAAALVLREALRASKKAGLSASLALANQNLGLVCFLQGNFADAVAYETAAVNAFAGGGDRRLEAASRMYLARVYAGAKSFDQAEAEALRALEVAGSAPDRAQAWGTLAEIALLRGDPASAIEHSSPALELIAKVGSLEEQESMVRLVYAEALYAANRREEARRAIDAARRRLIERAANISSPLWRSSFLEAVGENARTLALAKAWGLPDLPTSR